MLLFNEAIPASLWGLQTGTLFLPPGEWAPRGLQERGTRESDESAEQREWVGVVTPAPVYEGGEPPGDESVTIEQQTEDTQEDGDDDV